MTAGGLDVAVLYQALGVDLAASRRRVAAYEQVRQAAYARMAPAGAVDVVTDLEHAVQVLPTRAATATFRLVADADLTATARRRVLAEVPARHRATLVPLLDAARSRLRACDDRHLVAVSPRLAAQCRDLLIAALGTRHRQDGGLPFTEGMNALLRDLDGIARGRPQTFHSEPDSRRRERLEPAEEIGATEYAKRSGFARQSVTRLCREGRLPARRVGSRWLIATILEPADDECDSNAGGRAS